MGRKLALLPALVALLTTPVGAYALGLGNIKMRSALDQPMEAEIDLQVSNSAELDGLRVMLASDQLFRNAAVERAPFLSNLRFVIAKKSDGTPYIKVTSGQPVREPFLSFLVEASWPNGRSVRQYTVLVDPPTTTQESAPAVAAPKASAPATRPVVAPVAAAKPAETAPKPRASAGERVSRMTQRNDTLWILANEMRPGTQLSTHQMMVALQRENPDAFYQANMNRLKAGYVLRLKDQRAATSLSQAAAVAEVNRQYDEWKGVKRVATTAPAHDKKPSVAPAAKPAAASQPATARLKLVGASAQTATPGADAAKNAKPAAGMDKLQQDVAIANENNIARQQETEELRGRIAALEAQIANMQKAVTIKDKQLAELQQQGAVSTESAEVSGDLLQNPMMQGLAGLLVVLLGAGGWYLSQRRRKSADESILAPMTPTTAPLAAAAPVAAPAAVVAGADSRPLTASDSSFLTDFSVSSIEGIQTEVGEIDPMSEADVYLAYGRYNQAEEIMAQAIANDPSRQDYRLKLCEIHFAAKDAARFLRAAEAMHAAVGGATGPTWQRVAVMGRELCPNSPLFAAEGGGVLAGAAAAAAFVAADQAMADGGVKSDSSASHEDMGLDLASALDFGLSSTATANAVESKSEEADANLMEFDVSDWMSSSPEKATAEEEARRKLDDELASNSLSFDLGEFATPAQPAEVSEPVSNEFDMDFVQPQVDDTFDLVHASVAASEAEQAGSEDDFFKDLDLSFGAASQPSVDSSLSADLAEFEGQGAGEIDLSDSGTVSPAAETAGIKGLDDFDIGSFAPVTQEQGDAGFEEDALFADIDEIGTKLDLARAYIDMEDKDGARSLLDEILVEGNDLQRAEAQALLDKLG